MSFDRIAPYYRAMEWVLAGGKLQQCRVAWLDQVSQARRILLAGEGHGRLIGLCVSRFPGAQISCVDASSAMLRIAERQWRAAGGRPGCAEFIHAELPSWAPAAGNFDLVVTNFFFDCFPANTLAHVVRILASAASPGARWLVSDFAVPDSGWTRWRARLILAAAYAFFRRVTGLESRDITPPDGFLSRAGFRLAGRRTYEFGLLHSDLWMREAGDPAIQSVP